MTKPTIFLSTAEFSGDMHGAALVAAIRQLAPDAEFYGIGGQQMAAAGMEIMEDPTSNSTIGFIEIIKKLNRVKRVLGQITAAWEKRRPDLVIWLDSGGFNLLVAKEAALRGIPVVCMFSPSAWAYKQDRAVKLAERVKLLLAVLPFEAEFYRKFGANVIQVGHPLIDRVKPERSRDAVRSELGMAPGQKLVVLMPGSRLQEIQKLLLPMLGAIQTIRGDVDVKLVLPVAASLNPDWMASMLAPFGLPITLVRGGIYDYLAAADAAIIASGTATLEAALLTTPMVIVYQISRVSMWIYRRLETKEHRSKQTLIGLPNIIMDRMVVPELIQSDMKAKNIAIQLRRMLSDDAYNRAIRAELTKVKEMIGPPGVMPRAAALIMDVIREIRNDRI